MIHKNVLCEKKYSILKPWGHGATFSCVCNATLLHCMRLENFTVEPYVFYVRCNKNDSKNVACNTKKKKSSIFFFFFFSCSMQHFCCMKQIFSSAAPWSHSIKRFREAKLLLANHKSCLKRSTLERMFDFKNVHKQFYCKNNMALGKMTDEEKQTLIIAYCGIMLIQITETR